MKEYLRSKEAYLRYRCYEKWGITKEDWWYSIQIPPSESNVEECRKCKKDFSTFKKAIHSTKNRCVDILIECSHWCIWFEYFSFQRKSIAKSFNKCVVYYPKSDGTKGIKWYVKTI